MGRLGKTLKHTTCLAILLTEGASPILSGERRHVDAVAMRGASHSKRFVTSCSDYN